MTPPRKDKTKNESEKKARTRKKQDDNLQSTAKEEKGIRLLPILLWSCALLAVGIIVPRVLSLFPEFTNFFYTEGMYPVIRLLVGYIPSCVRVCITEIFVCIIVVAFFVCIIVFVLKLINRSFRIKMLFSFLCVLLLLSSLLLNTFNITGGINYHTVPLAEKLQLNVKSRTPTQLYGLCVWLRGEANSLRKKVYTDADGIFGVDNKDLYLSLTAEAVQNTQELNPKGYTVPSAKQVYFSKVMTAMGIQGINMPFFAESCVNSDQPCLLLFASAAHENAHYLGIAREDEANFAAYLCCMNSDNPNIRYSGTVLALLYASSRLAQTDRGLYTELLNGYSVALAADIQNYNEYWDKNENVITKLSSAVNDAYLKYNGTNGEASYGEMVDLLLAHYEKTNKK